jgi:GH43 family beta-xylosidase
MKSKRLIEDEAPEYITETPPPWTKTELHVNKLEPVIPQRVDPHLHQHDDGRYYVQHCLHAISTPADNPLEGEWCFEGRIEDGMRVLSDATLAE